MDGKSCPVLTETQNCNTKACPTLPNIYYYIDGYNKWAGEAENEYVCPVVGNNTSTGRCTFNNETDVIKYCNSDPSCLGYVQKTGPNNQLEMIYHPTKKVVAGSGIFKKK
jgi:hypothetical protein